MSFTPEEPCVIMHRCFSQLLAPVRMLALAVKPLHAHALPLRMHKLLNTCSRLPASYLPTSA